MLPSGKRLDPDRKPVAGRVPVGVSAAAAKPLQDQANVGVYADVIAGGTTRRGDPVTLA